MLAITNIRAARRGKKLSQTAMAKILNVNRQTYAGWEAGEARLSIDNLEAICSALELSVVLLDASEFRILQAFEAEKVKFGQILGKNRGEVGE